MENHFVIHIITNVLLYWKFLNTIFTHRNTQHILILSAYQMKSYIVMWAVVCIFNANDFQENRKKTQREEMRSHHACNLNIHLYSFFMQRFWLLSFALCVFVCLFLFFVHFLISFHYFIILHLILSIRFLYLYTWTCNRI